MKNGYKEYCDTQTELTGFIAGMALFLAVFGIIMPRTVNIRINNYLDACTENGDSVFGIPLTAGCAYGKRSGAGSAGRGKKRRRTVKSRTME